jgi:hypothetical protein
MQMRINTKIIEDIVKHFEDPKIQDMLEAIRVELKSDARKAKNEEAFTGLMNLAEKVMNEDFWCEMDYLLNCFYFDF